MWGDRLALRAIFHVSKLHFSPPHQPIINTIKMFNLYNRQPAVKEVEEDEFETDEEFSYSETEIEEFDAL